MSSQRPSHDHLLSAPLEELLSLASARRNELFGSRVTFSPKVFIPLTMLCRDTCGYCTFAQPPARLENPYLTADQVLAIAREGARLLDHVVHHEVSDGRHGPARGPPRLAAVLHLRGVWRCWVLGLGCGWVRGVRRT